MKANPNDLGSYGAKPKKMMKKAKPSMASSKYAMKMASKTMNNMNKSKANPIPLPTPSKRAKKK